MRSRLVLFLAVMCLLVGTAFARVTNVIDDLTPECRALQVAVQDAIGNEDPNVYRNHGQYVSAVAHMVGPEVEAGNISEECASCIISQFARRVPVEEQVPCGPDSPNPECDGAACGTFVPCNAPNSCAAPVCATVFEGGGVCVDGATPCAGLIACPGGTGDCPEGSVCAINSCCGGPVCVPPSAFCQPLAVNEEPAVTKTAPVHNGPTIFSPVPDGALQESAWGTIKRLYQ